jgi:hypothetical protein
MKNYYFSIKLACILIIMAIPSNTAACRCPEPLSPEIAYDRADVVVCGKALSVQGNMYKEGAIVRIKVFDAWKKKIHSEIDVFTSTTCAFDFQTGEEYLLYLYDMPEGKYYSTKKCVGNLPTSKAKKALLWIEQNGLHTGIED